MAESDIRAGDIVFYNDRHESWATNLVTDVLEVLNGIATIRTRGEPLSLPAGKLTRLPVDKEFRLYVVTRYEPKYASPD